MGTVANSFTAAAQNSAVVEGSEADLIIGGTFVATVQLQAAIPAANGSDTWVSVGQLTAPGVVKVSLAVGRKLRASCTAFTSGTILYAVSASRNMQFKEA